MVAVLPDASRLGAPGACETRPPSGRRRTTEPAVIEAGSMGSVNVTLGRTVTGTDPAPGTGLTARTKGGLTGRTRKAEDRNPREPSGFVRVAESVWSRASGDTVRVVRT